MVNRMTRMLTLPAMVALLGTAALAQVVAPSGTPVQAARPERGGAVQVERRIAGLQRRLKITPDEQPQWDAFATVMRQNATHMEALQHDRAEKVTTMNASEDMRSYAEVARVHADDLQHLATSFDALYAAMTPEQKTTADRIFHEFQGRRGRAPAQP